MRPATFMGTLVKRKHLSAMLLAALTLASHAVHADSPIVTQYTYDAGDHVATVTDPRGLVTAYTHDGVGQLWQQVSPDTGTTSYGYDSYGRRSSMTRADGVQTSYGYDGLNRMTSASAGGQTQTLTYDTCTNGIGRLCADSNSGSATSYSYTPEGRISGRGFTAGGVTYAVGYSYYAQGYLAVVTYPDGNTAVYTYNQGVVSNITLNMGSTSLTVAGNPTYTPGDRAMAAWTSSNGLSNTLGYDTDGRLGSIYVPQVQNLALTYDNANRITGITNGITPSLSQNFGYDDQSRLASVYSGADNQAFTYDPDGNRATQVRNGSTATFQNATTSNQQAGYTISPYQRTLQYDPDGNLHQLSDTTGRSQTLTFDPFNRLSSVNVNGVVSSYTVNPEGQRLSKNVGGTVSVFAPDASGALLAEQTGGQWTDYVWLNGRLVTLVRGGNVYAVHDDQVGRPEAVTNASQQVVWRASNYAFDRAVTTDTLGGLNLGFPGQYYDAETGYWNNGFRDYDSLLGRYVESDPIGLSGGVNSYAYAENESTMYSDVFGLCDDKKDVKTLQVVTVTATATADNTSESGIPTGPLPPPFWLLPPSSPIGKFIDDMLSKQLVKKLSHGALKINKYDKLEPTPIAFGIGLMLYSPPLGGCDNGTCADETKAQFAPPKH